MIYDAVARVAEVLAANFQSDWESLCVAKGVNTPPQVGIVLRQNVDAMMAGGTVFPAIGVYPIEVSTQAKVQGKRDCKTLMGFDFFRRGPIESMPTMLKQGELAAEAILLTIDRLPGVGSIWEAGGDDDSVSISFNDGYEAAPNAEYQQQVTVITPVFDRDEV